MGVRVLSLAQRGLHIARGDEGGLVVPAGTEDRFLSVPEVLVEGVVFHFCLNSAVSERSPGEGLATFLL